MAGDNGFAGLTNKYPDNEKIAMVLTDLLNVLDKYRAPLSLKRLSDQELTEQETDFIRFIDILFNVILFRDVPRKSPNIQEIEHALQRAKELMGHENPSRLE